MRNEHPSVNLSLTKSMLQHWFGRATTVIVVTRCRTGHLPPLFGPYDQALLPVQPVDALGIDMPTFAPQQHRQPPIPVTNMRSRQLSQGMSQDFTDHLPARHRNVPIASFTSLAVCRSLMQ